MTSRRPRRTRIYDANFRMGENSYKSALDNLDRKYSSNLRSTIRDTSLPRARVNFEDDTLSLTDARQRASRAITEETVFDSRGLRVAKLGTPLNEDLTVKSSTRDFDAEIQETLDKLSARRKQLVQQEDFKPSFRRRVEEEIDDSLASSATESTKFVKRRALKVVASVENAIDQRDLTKWTKLDANTSSFGTDSLELSKKKALETKNRLREIEDDMITRQERQLARERRAANLRKIINEDMQTDLEASMKAITF